MRKMGYLAFILFILIASWEQGKTDAAVTTGAIPEESIRLRILANSDSLEDQWIKRKLRDEIIEIMAGWAEQPATIDEARVMIEQRLPQFRERIDDTLRQYGYRYDYEIEVGQVYFPAKMYGNEVYPAGEYEAMRITLGEGYGKNWWCVLFPPLCFVDVVSGEAIPKDSSSDHEADDVEEDSVEPELRFFLWDLLQSILQHFSNLFA